MRDAKPPGFGPLVACKCGCGLKRHQFDANGTERKFIQGHGTRVLWRRYKEMLAKGMEGFR